MIVLRWSSEHKPFEDQGKQECLMRAQETKEKLWNL